MPYCTKNRTSPPLQMQLTNRFDYYDYYQLVQSCRVEALDPANKVHSMDASDQIGFFAVINTYLYWVAL